MPAPKPTPCIHAARGGPGSEDHIGVEMIPEVSVAGFEGGRALLDRREARALRDALDACLGDRPPGPALLPDAEQLVRLTGAVLTRVLNSTRHPDASALCEDDVTLGLGASAGVPLPTDGGRYRPRLLPYGAKPAPTPDSADRTTADAAPRRTGGA